MLSSTLLFAGRSPRCRRGGGWRFLCFLFLLRFPEIPEDERLEDFHIDSTPKEDSSDDQCIRALKRIGRCEDPGAPDDELSRDCREYIREISYGLCARLHVSDSDFFGDEWYLYVGSRFSDIWGDESDTILLLDGSGRLVDALTY